jgi:hypothetical protein
MELERARIVRVGPFDEVDLVLTAPDDAARPLTVIHGDSGTGKSSILAAIANTRPGKALPPTQGHRRGEGEAYVVCDWRLGVEDPQRPHCLRVASPNAKLGNDEAEQLRRREQAHFDRLAAEGPGYAFVEIPGLRYFARGALALTDPARALLRYDVRTGTVGVDPARPDLTRPCKQALAYAAISAALAGDARGQGRDARFLGAAMQQAVGAAVELAGFRYRGLDPHGLEPVFESPGGQALAFDFLPTQVKHLLAFVAIPLRTIWAAHRGLDPRETPGVVTIDDFDLGLSPHVLEGLLPVLRRAMPRVQWILTTGSPWAAAICHRDELVALRRLPESDLVGVYDGELALTH